MLACQTGNVELFEILIKVGCNIHATTPLGDTALTIAQKSGFQDLALQLVSKGASIRKRPMTPKTEAKPPPIIP